ncbi:MAG: aspartate-semialdehyde dehydrogenase [Deltaproteobacteria bacterium]|nr:aspartate-semialdehyde dehydrogenase [Deltaproteobacteria bacterium]
MAAKKKIALVGATGIAGQQFVAALAEHPWFELARLVGSERSAGKSYGDALCDPRTGARRWWCDVEPPAAVLALEVEHSRDFSADGVDLVFSAVEADVAREIEPRLARSKPVVSTASAFRYEDDVPILVPGVNWDHARLLPLQRQRRGWQGYLTPIPNCTTTGLAIALKPIHDAFGVSKVLLTSMQSVSGAGRSPGVVALDVVDNIVPFIPKEEEKVARETRKIFASLGEGGLRDADFLVSATCTRASVLEGHTESVSVSTEQPASPEQIVAALRAFDGGSGLPSAPRRWIIVHDDPFRPQPRIDRDAEGGMATSVGRIRPDPVLDNGIKFVLVSHNTKMGAAKGAVLVAEYLYQQGLV